MTATRRLAAILAADVAGYSRLMGADEEGTLDRLKAHRRALIDPKIHEHRGRLVKTTGDGMLVEFPSVVDAVRCAVEVQRGMVERNDDTSEDRRIVFRVGVNLGDVIVEDDDIFGDGVNVAARLEALAEPGGICISRTVRNQVRDKLPYEFEDRGEQSVKNIARPVRVDALGAAAVAATPLVEVKALPEPPAPAGRGASRGRMVIAVGLVAIIGLGAAGWWVWPGRQAPPPTTGATKPAPRLSIVVLPLANLSNDPEQEYFADGVTDDLTTDLSRIEGSYVIARNTAFTYKGKAVDVKQIGKELGVRYVLEGSVRRSGNQVQINVQLIDAETGAHLWADRFDTDRTNLAKTQDEITGRLARSLQLQLLGAASRQIAQEKNPDAADLAMRGWASYHDPVTKAQTEKTQHYFEQALALDPQSEDAKIGLAQVLAENYTKRWGNSPDEDLVRADQLLQEVFEHNRNDYRAQIAFAQIRRNQGRLGEARAAYEEALRLNRNSSTAMTQLGNTLTLMGEPETALPYLEKALQINSQDQNKFYALVGLGACHLLLNHPDQAVDFLTKARASSAQVWYIPQLLAAALGLKGDIDAAKVALAEFQKIRPIASIAKLHAAWKIAYDNPKYAALAEKTIDLGLRQAGLPEK